MKTYDALSMLFVPQSNTSGARPQDMATLIAMGAMIVRLLDDRDMEKTTVLPARRIPSLTAALAVMTT